MTTFSLHSQVLENLPEGITIQDRDFNIIYQNTAMKQAFGNQIGIKCYLAYEKRDHVCEGCGVEKAFRTGKSNMLHRTAITEGGEKTHWENSCFPLFDEEGNITAGVEVCRNITDRVALADEVRERSVELGMLNDELVRKQNELEEQTKELERAYQELQRTHTHLLQREKMASIGQLAAGIAHEINTPIQFVGDNIAFARSSFDELIATMQECQDSLGSEDTDTTELSKLRTQFVSLFNKLDIDYLKTEVPLALDDASEGARRVAEIVLAMKNFAHSSDKELEPVELDNLIYSSVEVTRNVWRYVADLKVELIDPPLAVQGQKGDLAQVLLNLILNAADAVTEKPRPEGELGEIRIMTRRNDDWGEILVEDSGCGMEPSLLKRIFEPFFTTKEVGKGSGQGLAIAYSLTEAHGGELLVESDPGQGSTFIVRLPLVN
jgi:PAS domain S-box-containing protein